MSAEKSLVLTFDREMKKEVLSYMKEITLDANDFTFFNPDKHQQSAELFVILKRDPELEFYTNKYPYTKKFPDKYIFGSIQVWIKESSKEISYEFWPVTKSLFDVLNNSTELKSWLSNLKKKVTVNKMYIDHGNGSFDDLLF